MSRRSHPSGCIGAVIGFGVIAGFIGGIFYLIFRSFTSSPVYIQAVNAAKTDSRVVQALGDPIQFGWFITGSLQEQGISGDANLIIPISGSRKSGTLYAAARRANGIWQFYTLAVRIDGDNELITLNPSR
ncbi:MAG: hypothetical protein HZB51_07680 [Chloroflexi bacterium]|nr:hypothetical protein [Chloroflexota bacterium]